MPNDHEQSPQTGGDPLAQRVCLSLPGMDAVHVQQDIVYDRSDPRRLLDVYSALRSDAAAAPAVVLVCGYPPRRDAAPGARTCKDVGWTVSMAQLAAASGVTAIAYAPREPVDDLAAVLRYVEAHSSSLSIDASRVGVVAMSGHAPTALATLMRDSTVRPSCALFQCGFMLDLDGATDVTAAAARWGFANPCHGRSIRDVRDDVPIRIVRAGLDQFDGVNASIDRFVRAALQANLPLELVNYRDGAHAFDLFENNRPSRSAVRQSLEFLRRHLGVESSA